MCDRQTASSMAMHAPWAMYCSIGCAASPSNTTRPSTQLLTGSRSHSTQSLHSLARSMIWRAFSCTWAKPRITSSRDTGLPATGLGGVIVTGDHQVKHLPARERIVHEMALRTRPQGRGIPAQIFGHAIGRNHRAIGGVTGDARRDRPRPAACARSTTNRRRRSARSRDRARRTQGARPRPTRPGRSRPPRC